MIGEGAACALWCRVCGGWRRHLDEERQLQEFSRQKENNQAGEHRKASIRHKNEKNINTSEAG